MCSSGNMYFYISVCSTHTSNMFKAFSPLLAGQLVENLYVKNCSRKRRSRRKTDITRRRESRCTRQTGSCTGSCTARLLPVIVLLIVVVVVVAVVVAAVAVAAMSNRIVYTQRGALVPAAYDLL